MEASRAHESQHVRDNLALFFNAGIPGLASERIPSVCMVLEARGFAREIPILEARIRDLEKKKDRCAKEDQELLLLKSDLFNAQNMANNKQSQRVYCMTVLGY